MRFLPAENASVIMDAVNDVFSDRQRNPFRYIRQNARVLAGEEEGAFAWLAANYLAGYFTGGKSRGPFLNPDHRPPNATLPVAGETCKQYIMACRVLFKYPPKHTFLHEKFYHYLKVFKFCNLCLNFGEKGTIRWKMTAWQTWCCEQRKIAPILLKVYKLIILHYVGEFSSKFTHRFQNLHICKYYLMFSPEIIFGGCLSKCRRTFIV